MEASGELSLPGRYYQGSDYVVRTPAEDEKIRRLIQDSMPPGVRYTPPLVVTPGKELPSDVDIWEGPVSALLVHQEAQAEQAEQAEAPVSFRQKATRAIIEFFTGR